jgi:hypothetical protein
VKPDPDSNQNKLCIYLFIFRWSKQKALNQEHKKNRCKGINLKSTYLCFRPLSRVQSSKDRWWVEWRWKPRWERREEMAKWLARESKQSTNNQSKISWRKKQQTQTYTYTNKRELMGFSFQSAKIDEKVMRWLLCSLHEASYLKTDFIIFI